ncbi:MAG: M3 family metallopeptidase [Bacteroidales bacterium]|nr:M3 family metallopeptidase [Bacteroidales bacterium]
MKKLLILVFILPLAMTSCKQDQKSSGKDNPFFSEYNTPYGVPPFDEIRVEHFIPAFEKGMEEHKKEVEAILGSKEEPTFQNTIVAMDNSGKLLNKVAYTFFGLSSANTSTELQEVQMEISPRLAQHSDEISLDPRFFEKVELVYNNRANFNLNSEEEFLLENIYKELVRNGSALEPEKKEKLKEMNQRLSVLRVQFSQNVLAETNNYMLEISKEEDLAGLPESVINSAAEEAVSRGLDGKWVFTTQKPSMLPFLQYSEKPKLREKLYNAYLNRGNNDNDYDNKEIVAEIMEIRADRAKLLGYETHSHLVLEPRMAKEPANVYDLLNTLWSAAMPAAKKDLVEMQAIADREGDGIDIQSSDWWYYAEKLRKEKYDLDDNELRPYFKLENVKQGAFTLANKLYGITFTEIMEIPKPHEEAVAYEVKEENGEHLGVLYLDFHPRESKNQGAWCGSYRDYKIEDGKEITPVVTMVMNFTRPSGDKPSLLSLDEVSTLFHEFGHALDGLFSTKTYGYEYIAWDFVELPSQIMEHWVTEPEMLKTYALHYETGEPIPDELIEKIRKSSLFNQGFAKGEYLAACYLDMAYHTIDSETEVNIPDFEKNAMAEIGLIPEIEPRYRSTYFGHIIGGYDSGYYSYDWAAVLDHDAYEAFKEKGIFDRETAQSFRENILEKNGTMDAMQMYVNFRGREPERTPLLRNLGFLN